MHVRCLIKCQRALGILENFENISGDVSMHKRVSGQISEFLERGKLGLTMKCESGPNLNCMEFKKFELWNPIFLVKWVLGDV